MTMKLPMLTPTRPADLTTCRNGYINPAVHRQVHLPGSTGWMHHTAADQLEALAADAKTATGCDLSSIGMFRTLAVQEAGFFRSYVNKYDPMVCQLRHQRIYRGQRWWLRRDTTPKATPGESDHGDGLAIDVAYWNGSTRLNIRHRTARPLWTWLVANATRYGYSWAYPNEGTDDPHLEYRLGDTPPPRPAPDVPAPVLEQTATSRLRANPEVATLQRVCNFWHWHDGPPLTTDGRFGPRTRRAVELAQAALHTPITGRWDQPTATAYSNLLTTMKGTS